MDVSCWVIRSSIVVAAAFLGCPKSYAETIVLACEGFAAPSNGADKGSFPTGAQSFILDSDNKSVQSSIGDFSITHWGAREIRFESRAQPAGNHVGKLDRITGEAVTWITREGQTLPYLTFIMDCQPAKPKF